MQEPQREVRLCMIFYFNCMIRFPSVLVNSDLGSAVSAVQ